MKIQGIHHVAIICSDYQKSKSFYTDIIGFEVMAEVYREERASYKLDLSLNGSYSIELFSFPDPPKRVSRPEASGLRHIAFSVTDIQSAYEELVENEVQAEPIRIDEFTNKRFFFIFDPDGLPIEFYESAQ
ncbi:SMU1112c/YaeR family gloxylase I-like metalloprotein [Flavobacterium silvaticum]|uniref:VOC family protein n=1 Tax=Flavobacterium silvaticum TaxID=1852020 RepID=A0A972FLG5_9FLAO|nr:VOC family protein [Flavobacterium silvaticum]NMH27827.1 VOC family protein [Flavobacterium silvaticum]